MKIFILIFILSLIFNIEYSEAGTPTYYTIMEVPPSTGMRVLDAPRTDEENVKSVFEALVIGDIDQVIENAERIKERVEHNKEAKLSLEKVVNGLFENKDESC